MNLVQFDLNLLVALDALLRERNVTRAGQRIGVSQPAMSGTSDCSPASNIWAGDLGRKKPSTIGR